MAYSYAKLIGRIVEKCGTRKAFATAMNFSECTLAKKLSNKVAWKQDEIDLACDVLGLELSEVPAYFFAR